VKYLQIANLALLALGITLTVVVAVECLIYAVYLDASPSIGRQLPLLLEFNAVLGAFSLGAFLAYAGHRAHWKARWITQVLPVLGLAGAIATLVTLRR
jgi:peptidoglycan/LPS O-acetylase OafA/YrhL